LPPKAVVNTTVGCNIVFVLAASLLFVQLISPWRHDIVGSLVLSPQSPVHVYVRFDATWVVCWGFIYLPYLGGAVT
jgi:hypothetical protein